MHVFKGKWGAPARGYMQTSTASSLPYDPQHRLADTRFTAGLCSIACSADLAAQAASSSLETGRTEGQCSVSHSRTPCICLQLAHARQSARAAWSANEALICRRLTLRIAPQTARPRLTALQCRQRGGSERPTACSPAGPSSAPPPSRPAEQTEHRLTMRGCQQPSTWILPAAAGLVGWQWGPLLRG